ncbi:hypothetical protein PISMIDRAFT_558077 [Pisolithus microcarpus 441]|uniref:Uncharacterized protein n=1 Tax=Pisolithus microcarpus 441 TaxID=765257 RepID=A0A0C9YV54_9AGAM|nr:hypothetical protein PISMIDRAFT_558077 [Pisolithus microcarpus 441]
MAGPARDAVRRRPKCKENSASGGLISSVFSFVSREIESFVVSATGGQVNITSSSSTVKSEKPSTRKRQRERRSHEIQLSEGENSNRHRQRRRSSKTNTGQPNSRSKSADAARKHHYKRISPAYVEDADEGG